MLMPQIQVVVRHPCIGPLSITVLKPVRYSYLQMPVSMLEIHMAKLPFTGLQGRAIVRPAGYSSRQRPTLMLQTKIAKHPSISLPRMGIQGYANY